MLITIIQKKRREINGVFLCRVIGNLGDILLRERIFRNIYVSALHTNFKITAKSYKKSF